ncbi:V-type proton ATPase subunit E [mine drainage metagenome]|uniref:V-type proton ATPase subunit E n=1 Tax=mine drainage metagenome TaxID=410659 RepID=A0A1J5QM42_9ZZZZ
MSALSRTSSTALEPVRAALRAHAERESAQVWASAEAQVVELRESAHRECARIRADAAAEGAAVARGSAALRSARTRREAHEMVLTRQEEVYAALVAAVGEAASALRADPRYPELRDRLTERARELLGPQAVVTESPVGGIVAHEGSRRLDLSLPTIAETTLGMMAPEVSTLWTS